MSQISPPIRILLVAVIGLIAVYMLFLRPKTEEATPAATTPAAATAVPAKDPNAKTSSGSGAIVQTAIQKTTSASEQAKIAAGETPGGLAADATTGTATATGAAATGVTATSPVTKETLARLPKDVRGPVAKHKVIVLLFYNNRSADDRAVRRALSHVSTYGGQVFINAHWIKNVARYQAITRGVDVEQSPTIVIADRNLKAETLVGFADQHTIDQKVVDAILANGGSLIRDPYVRKLEAVCASTNEALSAIPAPATPAAVPANLAAQRGVSDVAFRSFVNLTPPKRHVKLYKQMRVWEAHRGNSLEFALTDIKSAPSTAAARLRSVNAEAKADNKQFVKKNGRHGLSCF